MYRKLLFLFLFLIPAAAFAADFGSVTVGSVSAEQQIAFYYPNTRITDIRFPAGFRAGPHNTCFVSFVGPNGCNVTAVFAPTSAIGYSGNISVTWLTNVNTFTDLYPVSGTGVPVSDTTPAPFSFTSQSGAALSTPTTSNTVTPTGYNAATTISVSGGSYSINGGAFTSTAGMISPGQNVAVRQTSSGAYNTTTTATLTIGGVPGTFSVTTQPAASGLRFVPVAPCRVADTRNAPGPFGGPVMDADSTRNFTIPASSCDIPATAQAYSLNVTVVPQGSLSYLTIWPTGQPQPLVSTLNSLDGRIKANAAIVAAGTSGAVSVFTSDTSHVILDINGYFTTPANAPSGLLFYPVTPCRVMDTRNPPGPLGGLILAAGAGRTVPMLLSACGLPGSAAAYSINMTVVPTGSLGYLTTWPTGSPQPLVSTLNDPTATIVANAAIVPAGTGGSIEVFATDQTHLIIDVNGYFAPPTTGGLLFYALTPCRVVDTRNPPGPFGGPSLSGQRDFDVLTGSCGVPATTKAYSLNATVVPPGPLGYLTLWPVGQPQPTVSTLNAPDASIVSNAAVVPTSSGAISAFSTDTTDLILDINGFFAP